MFFVAGITGHVGGATAKHLLSAGHKVRALARDPQKASAWAQQGVEVRAGDLTSASDVAAALQGVEGAYLMLPPEMAPERGFPKAKVVIESVREALHKAPPPRLVVLSSIGSEQPSKLGNITTTHLLEEALADVTFPVAFIRAGSFFENYVFNFQMAAKTGRLDSFLSPTNRPVPMIATDDIGKEVARLLTSTWTGKKIVELGSPLSPDDLARAMGEVHGRSVEAKAIPREQWSSVLEHMGLAAGAGWSFEEMEDSFNSGWIHFGVPGTESVAGTLTPAQFFAQVKRG